MPEPIRHADDLIASIRDLRQRGEQTAAQIYWNARRTSRSVRRLSETLQRVRRSHRLRIFRPDPS
jgi:hypothetical protein